MTTQANQTIKEQDILVILYPNSREVKSLIIIDPYDGKVSHYDTSSLEEVRRILRENLPFCAQGHSPIIHLGGAIMTDWKDLPTSSSIVRTPEDIEKLLR
jgi:hypothetical protein